jgi:hypothetical protein
MRSPALFGLGCGALLFLSVGACIFASGVQALLGGAAMTFDCTRATGSCTLHRTFDEPIELASITGTEVVCGEVHVGSGGSTYETQCNLYATTSSGRRSLGEDSADPTTEAEYRAAAAQIDAFVHGDAPTLHTAYTSRQSTQSWLQSLLGGGAFFAIGAGLVWMFVRRRRAATAT